ncbi:hypothetical protein BDZ94DRAFT_1260281 [Collybia nuda]|uniref:Uncharacterized protein n=1 Tax=Collybia nuda TaxID=64659 RepID=A0A9P6CI54_9AGAR|nr:hypothetical protein BDZ94DRAFT_1260281 [Collybia nuda]
MVARVDAGDAGGDQGNPDARSPVPPIIPPVLQEPPFMTDGRGRVIWTNSSTNKVDVVGLAVITSSPSTPFASSPTLLSPSLRATRSGPLRNPHTPDR